MHEDGSIVWSWLNLLSVFEDCKKGSEIMHEHLGDGVYVEAGPNVYGIILKANDHLNPTDTIALEPAVLKALIVFIAKEGIVDE